MTGRRRDPGAPIVVSAYDLCAALYEHVSRFLRARQGDGYVLQCDIAGYFRSIDHEVLESLLARRIGDQGLLPLLSSLAAHGAETRGVGVPIGSLTGQMFANLYLDPLDRGCEGESWSSIADSNRERSAALGSGTCRSTRARNSVISNVSSRLA